MMNLNIYIYIWCNLNFKGQTCPSGWHNTLHTFWGDSSPRNEEKLNEIHHQL